MSLLLPVLRIPDVMLRLSFIAFALSLLATIDAVAQQQGPAPATNPPPPSITLEQAIAMARANEPAFAAAAGNARIAALDHSIAQAALLPNATFHTAGEATVLEVVDAENSLTAVEIAREDGTVRYQLALTNLQLLTGAI